MQYRQCQARCLDHYHCISVRQIFIHTSYLSFRNIALHNKMARHSTRKFFQHSSVLKELEAYFTQSEAIQPAMLFGNSITKLSHQIEMQLCIGHALHC